MSGSTRTVISYLLIALIVSLAQAQNARINALGGANIVTDFSRTIYNPAVMNDYRNNAEINFGAGGAIMGTKSAGDVFSIGVALNRGLILNKFYTAADSLLGIFGSSNMQYFPHLLWGFDMKTLQIGFDTYLEWARSTYHYSNAVPGATQTIDEEVTIYHPGLVAGFKINLPAMSIMFHLGGGLPTATGTVTGVNTLPPLPVGTAKMETEEGLFGRGGIEVTSHIGPTDLTIGADGKYEAFQFSTLAPAVGSVKVRTPKINELTITPFAGTQTHLANNVLLVFMGKSAIDILTDKNDPGTITLTGYQIRHALIAGIEKQFQKPWKFDSLAVRGGVNWGAVNTWNKSENTTSTVLLTTTTKLITTLGPMFPYAGLGLSKRIFRLDVLINPTSWSGAFAGPAVSMATVSLRF